MLALHAGQLATCLSPTGVYKARERQGGLQRGSLPYCHVIPGVTAYNLCRVLLVRSNLLLSFRLGKGIIWGVSWGRALRSVCYSPLQLSVDMAIQVHQKHEFGLVKMRKDTPPHWNSYVIYLYTYLDCVPHLCIFQGNLLYYTAQFYV